MNFRLPILIASVLALTPFPAKSCMWDSDTLADEKKKSPKLAEVILGPAPKPADSVPLRARIQKLKAQPHEDDPAWWNDLAGAHLRLGQPAEAAKLLEPLLARFPNDYGMHANLGTAYHLLGRYKDAEREIARDLELNPEGHFGLEKYHLALLQYLVRDAEYQKQHVYVDAWSESFMDTTNSGFPRVKIMRSSPFAAKDSPTQTVERVLADLRSRTSLSPNDEERLKGLEEGMKSPEFLFHWNLSGDTKLEEGVLYMASLNPKQSACFTMLGLVCLQKRGADLNLAAAAFQRAIDLGSPQKGQLLLWITEINSHIHTARGQKSGVIVGMVVLGIVVLVLGACALLLLRWLHRKLTKAR